MGFDMISPSAEKKGRQGDAVKTETVISLHDFFQIAFKHGIELRMYMLFPPPHLLGLGEICRSTPHPPISNPWLFSSVL